MPPAAKTRSSSRRGQRASTRVSAKEFERLVRALPGKVDAHIPLMALPPPALPRALRCFHRASAEDLPRGVHANPESFVLLIGLRGTSDITLDDVTVAFRPGDAVLIFPHQFHCYRHVTEPLLWAFINFSANECDWLPLKYSVTPFTPPLWRHVIACLTAYLAPERDTLYASSTIAVETWRLLMGLLEYQEEQPFSRMSRRDTPQPHFDIIRTATQFIIANLNAPISVKDVARHAGVSVTSLQFAFHTYRGQGVGEYIRHRRATLAARLLGTSDDPLKVIAHQCGFSSPNVFSRSFKTLIGQSPAQYRSQLRRRRRGISNC